MKGFWITGPMVWQSRCGVRGVYTKYQEGYKVLGNQWKMAFLDHRYSEIKDMSYISNTLEVSKVLVGFYERQGFTL
tara:strand:+ start:2021 stop:2248 length:228 start_codon:yes stop_codon:yes gene_type:complete